MNRETGSFAGCVKHPSQVFTGFCSSCLVERLSNVGSIESTKSPSCCVRNERVEISEPVPDSHRKGGGVRARKTLLSLFELDDLNDREKMGDKGLDDRAGASRPSPAVASGYPYFHGDKREPSGDESSKDNSMSFWLSLKGLKWSRSTSKRSQAQERCSITGVGSTYLENKHHIQASCDWTHDPGKVIWEKSRHSWDGSMMSKALACSFFCLEEQQDGSANVDRSLTDEASSSGIQRYTGEKDLDKVNSELSSHPNSIPLDGSFEGLTKEFNCEEISQDNDASDGCRKKSNGWSRVWDWNITSPFRDFAKRNGHVLERSLSESWRDNHKDDNLKNLHADIELHRNRTPLNNAPVNRSLNKETITANDSRQGQKPDSQKMRELKTNRSHSVRYSSPRNLDNGLLRFYLTPLRTSRRNMAKCRKRTSHSLSRGFLGL